MSYLEKRRNLYYAVLTVPETLRETLGRLRFRKSTGTANKRDAEHIAAQYVSGWKHIITQTEGKSDSVLLKAIRWREELERTHSAEHREAYEHILQDKAEEIAESQGLSKAQEFYGIATGTKVLTSIHFEAWQAQLDLVPKTVEHMIKEVQVFIDRFATLDSVMKQSVKAWINDMSTKGRSNESNKRTLSFCRNYWKYLQTHDIVRADSDPFKGVLEISKSRKSTDTITRLPFSVSDIPKLYNQALAVKKDNQLADLILLGSYTGARIEEICSLKLTDITEDNSFKIIVAKTKAGVREVPIHTALIDVVNRLKEESTDGYLMSGLSLNKYGDRADAVGKRFGRLKTSLGYSSAYVFHSIRKTVVTLLENAGVTENVTADIVGHEKPRITYGLYSGGTSLEVKREALDKVSYPF